MKGDTLILREFSYKIRGLLFDVQNELGSYCKESQYGDLFEGKLKKENILYRREFVIAKSFEDERHHRNRVDFIVKEKNRFIVIEFKTVPAFSREHYYQCQRYLHALNLELALLVNFRPKYVMIKRILNPDKKHK